MMVTFVLGLASLQYIHQFIKEKQLQDDVSLCSVLSRERIYIWESVFCISCIGCALNTVIEEACCLKLNAENILVIRHMPRKIQMAASSKPDRVLALHLLLLLQHQFCCTSSSNSMNHNYRAYSSKLGWPTVARNIWTSNQIHNYSINCPPADAAGARK